MIITLRAVPAVHKLCRPHSTRLIFAVRRGECVRLKNFVVGAKLVANTIQNCGLYDFKFGDQDEKNGEGIYIGTSFKQVRMGTMGVGDACYDNGITFRLIFILNDGAP